MQRSLLTPGAGIKSIRGGHARPCGTLQAVSDDDGGVTSHKEAEDSSDVENKGDLSFDEKVKELAAKFTAKEVLEILSAEFRKLFFSINSTLILQGLQLLVEDHWQLPFKEFTGALKTVIFLISYFFLFTVPEKVEAAAGKKSLDVKIVKLENNVENIGIVTEIIIRDSEKKMMGHYPSAF